MMKYVFIVLAISVTLLITGCAEKSEMAEKGEMAEMDKKAERTEVTGQYGNALTVTEVTNVSDILADPENFDGKRVLVEGKITDVCEMMGCWIMLQGDDPTMNIRFKVEDGVIEFPMEVKGKMARAEGIVSVKMLTVEEQITQGQHHAEETGATFDESTVTGPKQQIQLSGEGAIVL
jgi:hypothetical protein